MPHSSSVPSEWVERFAPLVPAGGPVLDLAAGAGRHTALFLQLGHPVTAVDIDTERLRPLASHPRLHTVRADLEGAAWPLDGAFAGVIVTNYLWRPLFPHLAAAVAPGGVLIYETFARGNERFGKPSNPDFLLKPNELRDVFGGELEIIEFEQVETGPPRPSVVQRLAARRSVGSAEL